MLNKPAGHVTTVNDQFGRPAVTDLIKTGERLYPVGRLDYDTSGLLILTNDGDLCHRMSHPSFGVKKIYIARVRGRPSGETVERFKKGIDIGECVTKPAELEIKKREEGFAVLKITITEGKNRQVKKMCEALGLPVVSLKRTGIAGLRLGDLREGEHRRLTEKEIAELKRIVS